MQGETAEVFRLPNCDFCMLEKVARPAKYDFKTRNGPWANGCESHFQQHGIGLGTGYGQRLILIRGKRNG